MEMSHRSPVYQQIIDEAEQDLRDLMNIPDNYKVLFIQGGATLQFAMIPMNLMKNGVACYVETGAWSKKAIAEAKSTATCMWWLPARTATTAMCPIAAIWTFPRIPIMCISARMRPSTA